MTKLPEGITMSFDTESNTPSPWLPTEVEVKKIGKERIKIVTTAVLVYIMHMNSKPLFFITSIALLCLSMGSLIFSCRIEPEDVPPQTTAPPQVTETPGTTSRILPGDIEAALHTIVNKYPGLTELRTIGNSAGTPSYPIYGLKVTDNPGLDEFEPEIQIIGGIHGNEQLSCMIVLKFLEYITDNYATDQVIADLVNTTEIHFFPSVNPHGLSGDIRYNANYVDINRNFGWSWVDQTYHGDSAFDQPESRAIRDDAIEHPYVISLLGHTGETCINTLWDYIGTDQSNGIPATYTVQEFTDNYLPAYPFITDAASTYLDHVNTAGDTGFWMTEGYDWYSVYGSIQDWLYGERGIMAFTLEYHNSSSYDKEDDALFNEVFGYHREALIDMCLYARRGIAGRVLGSGSLPVEAKVYVLIPGKKAYTDPVPYTTFGYTDPDEGDYHIPVQAGTYTLEIEADGYITHTETNVVVPANDPWVCIVNDIQLIAGKSEKRIPSTPLFLDPERIPPDLRQE